MPKQITLNIDGREVAVPEGTTVLEAAKAVGIEIPRLCHLEGLPASGTCRMCLVELDGQKRLAVSCTQRAKEGMVVHTHTDRVREARRFVLELIWSAHPGDCTTCEKSGACDLQRYTYDYDVDKNRYPLHIPEGFPTAYDDPLIERDLRLCILCGRCIRACREKSQGILDFMKRGMATVVTTSLDKPLSESGCDFCGSCIAVCPVGCLIERNRRLRGREWELVSAETRCGLCSLGCDQVFDLAHGEVVRARPGQDGYLCVRGKFGWDYLASEDRLTTPLIRDGAGFREVDWDEALDAIALGMSGAGSDKAGGIIGGHVANEAAYLFEKLFRESVGTDNVDTTARLAGADAIHRVIDAFGSLDVLASVTDLERAKKILVVGTGLGEAYPRARLAIARAVSHGAKLVVIDPSESELSRLATVHLEPNEGTEPELVGRLVGALTSAGLHNERFLACCEGFPASLPRLRTYDAGRTGVPEEALAEAARLLAKGKGAIVLSDLRPETVERALALLMVTGRSKRALLPVLPLANPWGVTLLTRGDAARRTAGLTVRQMLAKDSPISALYVVGADPASWHDGARETLTGVDFLVVQDLFVTNTAKLADVVLPLNGSPEEEGTFLSAGGKVIRVGSALPPVAPPLWRTLVQLRARLGNGDEDRSVRDVRAEVRDVLKEMTSGDQLRFPTLDPTTEQAERSSTPFEFGRFDLPEGMWTARSQVAELASRERPAVGSRGAAGEEVAE